MKEIKEKGDAELKKLKESTKEKLRSLRFKVGQKQLKDVRDLRQAKKDLARILTEINKRKKDKLKNKKTSK